MVLRWSDDDRAATAERGAPVWPHRAASGIRKVTPGDETPTSSSTVSAPPPPFVELYRAHFAYVWKSARRLGVSSVEVDDVVQETFLTVHRLLDSYAHQGSERAWLFSVLFRIVQRHHRSNRRRSVLTDEGANVDALAGSPACGPERTAETNETVRLLETILESFDPESRAILVLAEIEGRTMAEIAEILAINPNTIASRLRAARAHLEAAMTRHRARDGWRYK